MKGIHHITAIAGNPARNLDFYTRVLGLRLVKKTVNFDDPGTYHLYFGDEAGSPGTILTFFPWEHASHGRNGVGLAQTTSFRVPEGALGYWASRFVEKGVRHDGIEKRFGQSVLPFHDPDGMSLALVGVPGAESEAAWTGSDVSPAEAVRGFDGVSLLLGSGEKTVEVLTRALGFKEVARDGTVTRYAVEGATQGARVDIREAPGFLEGRMGRGSVHHIAFRATDDTEQADMRHVLARDLNIHATEQMDRNYFRSIYFREPGGVIFEIATDAPGFSVDEPLSQLGRDLKLPRFLENRRKDIEAHLVPLEALT